MQEVQLNAVMYKHTPFHIVLAFIMSIFHLSSNFGVAGASHVSSVKQVGDRSVTTFHYVYDTMITFHGTPSMQANLRVYSPPNDTLFTNQSIIFAFCKAYTLLNV